VCSNQLSYRPVLSKSRPLPVLSKLDRELFTTVVEVLPDRSFRVGLPVFDFRLLEKPGAKSPEPISLERR
jgi:hypothetical protein